MRRRSRTYLYVSVKERKRQQLVKRRKMGVEGKEGEEKSGASSDVEGEVELLSSAVTYSTGGCYY